MALQHEATPSDQHEKKSDDEKESKMSDFKLFIAVDFGTDGLGIAYAYNGEISVHSKYISKRFGATTKPKTMILIKASHGSARADYGKAVSFGLDARYSYMDLGKSMDDLLFFERFKMSLYEHELEDDIEDSKFNFDSDEDIKDQDSELESKETVSFTDSATPPPVIRKHKTSLSMTFANHYNKLKNERKKQMDNEKELKRRRENKEMRPTYKQGWLKKRSRYLKKWKKRYTRIEDEYYLCTYENEYTHEYTERIDLKTATLDLKADKPNQFKLITNTSVFWFECENDTQLNGWAKCISHVISPEIIDEENETDDCNDKPLQKEQKYKINIRDQLKAANGTNYGADYVFVAVLKHVKEMTDTYITDTKRQWNIKPHEIQWIITVPAIWSDEAKNKMKQWTIKAELVDADIKDQCLIVYEPDCASLAIQHEIYNHKMKQLKQEGIVSEHKIIYIDKFEKGEKYLLVDAGGGTVDVAVHEILGEFGVKEVVRPNGGKWGSCYIDDEYINLLKKLFGKKITESFRKDDATIFVWIMYFFQQAKCQFFEDETKLTHACTIPAEFVRYLEEKLGCEEDEEKLFKLVNSKSIDGEAGLVRLCEEGKETAPPNNLSPNELLELWNLSQYLTVVTNDYPEVEDWKYLDLSELKEMGFKTGHAKKFMQNVKKLESSKSNKNKQENDTYWLEIDVKIWEKMFDKVINKTVEHVKKLLEMKKVSENCKYLCLVGGLSCSKYFRFKMRNEFGEKSEYGLQTIIPTPPILAVVKGAAYFAITKNYIRARVLKRSYGVEVYKKYSVCIDQKISKRFIEKNKEWDQQKEEYWVRGCFQMLVNKDREVHTGEVIVHTVYRKNDQTMRIKVPILRSNKLKPKIWTDGEVLGQVLVDFDEKDKGKRAVDIKFYFGETMLRVLVYKKHRPTESTPLELEYFSYK